VILTMDGADLQYHVALDKKTGKTVWKTDRSVAWNDENVPGQMAKDGDMRKAHSTPLIVTAAGRPQMLSAGAKAAYGYDPRTGRELWKVQYPDFSAAPRPVFDRGLAFIVTGLTKKELWAVKTDGQGDVTDTAVVWKLKTRVGKYASPILVDGLIYTPAEESFVTCLEAATGETVWTERVGQIRRFANLCRRADLSFRSARRDHRSQARPCSRGFGDEHAGERLHGFAGGGRQSVLPEDQDAPLPD
jgi:outer membrane protein assembly factor BamB